MNTNKNYLAIWNKMEGILKYNSACGRWGFYRKDSFSCMPDGLLAYVNLEMMRLTDEA
jgi:hypothetical protein